MKMRISACFLWVLMVSGCLCLQAAETAEQELQMGRELIAAGKSSQAAQVFRRLLARKETTDEIWEQVIRLQMEGGLLGEAAGHADALVKRSGQSPPKAAYMKLREEVFLRHVKAMDKLLSLQSWADVGQDEEDFCDWVPKLLRRGVMADPAKAAAALKRAYEVLLQSPRELNAIEAGRVDRPSWDFLSSMGQAPGLMGTVWDLAGKAGATRSQEWCSRYIQRMELRQEMGDYDYILSLFTDTPIVAEAGEFRDLALPGNPGFPGQTFVGEVVSYFRQETNRDVRRKLQTSLATRLPKTFGQDLVETLMTDGEDHQKLMEFLKRRQEDLGRLSDEGAGTMLALLSTRFYALTSPAPLGPELAERVRPLLEAETWHLDSVRFTWKQARGFEELNLDPASSVGVAVQVFKRLAVRDPVQAVRFMEDAVRLFRLADDKDAGPLVKSFLQEAAGMPETLKAVLKTAEREGLVQQADWLTTTLARAWRPGDHAEQPQRLVTFLEAAGLLGDVAAFTAYWRTDEPHARGLVNRIQGAPGAQTNGAKSLVPLLEARQPRTFGAEVLVALFKSGREQSLLQVARQYRSELEALPADRQGDMARFFALWVRDHAALTGAVPTFGPTLKMNYAERVESAKLDVDRLLRAGSLRDLSKNPSGRENSMPFQGMLFGQNTALFGQMAESIVLVHATDPQKAEEAFQKGTNLVESAGSSNPGIAYSSRRLQEEPLGIWLLAAMEHPVMIPWAMQALRRTSPNPDYGWIQMAEEKMFPATGFREAKAALGLLDRQGLLVEADVFQPLVMAQGRHQIELVARRLTGLPEGLRRAMGDQLKAWRPATFGSVVVAALCENRIEDANELLTTRQADLEKLSDERQQMILQSLSQVFPGVLGREPAPPRHGAVGLLLDREDRRERQYLDSLRTGEGEQPGVLLLRGPTQLTGAELEKLLDSGDRAAATAFFDGLMLRGSAVRKTEPYRLAVFHVDTGVPQSRLTGLLRFRRNARMVGYLLDRIQADDSGRLGVAGPSFASLAVAGLEASWLHAGGWARPAPAAERLLAELAAGMADAPPVVAAPVLGGFLKRLPAAARKEVLQWAAGCAPGSPGYALARELAAAGALQQAIAKGEVSPESRTVWQHYVEALADGPAAQRVLPGVMAYWCQETPWGVPPALVVPAARVVVQRWNREQFMPPAEASAILESFAAAEHSEWRPVAEAFAQEWKARTTAARENRIRMVQVDAWHASLGILARLGDQECLDLFAETYKTLLSSELWPAGVLARHGQTERAARLLERDWLKLTSPAVSLNREAPAGPLPDPAAQAAFAQVFEPDKTDLVLLGELAMLLECRPRGEMPDATATAKWEQMMYSLVIRLVTSPVKEAQMRRAMHGLILRVCPQHIGMFTPLVSEDVKLAPEELGRYNRQSPEAWAVESVALDAAFQVRLGGVELISKNLQEFNAAQRSGASSSSWQRSAAAGQYLLRLLEVLAPGWSVMPPDRQAAVMEAVAAELEGAGSFQDEDVVRWVVDCWREAEGKPAVASSNQGALRLYERTLVRAKVLLTMLASGRGGKPGLPLDFRIRLFAAAMKKPEFQAVTAGDLLATLPLLTPEEAVAAGARLVAGQDQGGKAVYELAAVAYGLGQDKEALALLNLPVGDPAQPEQAPKKSLQLWAAPDASPGRESMADLIQLRKAALQLRLGQREEARATLKTVREDSSAPGRAALMKMVEGEGEGARDKG